MIPITRTKKVIKSVAKGETKKGSYFKQADLKSGPTKYLSLEPDNKYHVYKIDWNKKTPTTTKIGKYTKLPDALSIYNKMR